MNNNIHAKGSFCQIMALGAKCNQNKLKYLLAMKLAIILLLVFSLQAFAGAHAQKVNLHSSNQPLSEVLKEIRRQSGYAFLYKTQYLKDALPVSIEAKDRDILEVLPIIFEGQPFDYSINKKVITLIPKAPLTKKVPLRQDTVRGTVTDSVGQPLAGVSVKIEGTRIATTTNAQGRFTLPQSIDNAVLVFKLLGYAPYKETASSSMRIVLQESFSTLDETVVIGYGETSKRLNTGSVATVSAKEIEQQPVTNVLSALSGRMAGVFVQTTNGLPGGNINIQIRGTGSIAAGTNPLYIIDGVPFDGSTVNTNTSNSNVAGALSPLNSINPDDIESISVLKDADATAIYGSRGSNGVVLITTKKGLAGTTRTSINLYQGINETTNYPKLLNLEQYLDLRREAFANDGRIPSANPTSPDYAPDLTVWSQTESTDWPRYLLGGTGNVSNVQISISGGSANTMFNLGANYRAEGTVLPGDSRYNRAGLHVQLQHASENKRFRVAFSGTYNADDRELANPVQYQSANLLLPPNYPLFNADGSYNWYNGSNVQAELNATARTNAENLIGNLQLGYMLFTGLNLKTSIGYTNRNVTDVQRFPTNSIYPGTNNYSQFGDNSSYSFIVEPQLDYHTGWGTSKMNVLIGATYQSMSTKSQYINAEGFSNESLMENLASASIISQRSNAYTAYRYASLFGRVTYNFMDRYILNGTIRRDGSSRFGPGNQYGNFAAIGGAWLFSNEHWFRDNISFISSGKLRGSYGSVGNDQITAYQYLSTYGTPGGVNTYQGIGILRPNRISNADFRWETTRKLEAAMELGFIKDRLLLATSYYRNRSDNQLVNYRIPNMTGFSSYQANLPAEVENRGWEFSLTSENISNGRFRWNTNFNFTIPTNVLRSFENFETSNYANTLRIGEDITRIFGYQFLGIDSETGLAQYADINGQMSTNPYFFGTIGKQTPDFYGGIGNSFIYKGFQLDIFGQFAKQQAWGGLIANQFGHGAMNGYVALLERWQNPSDVTDMPKVSATFRTDTWYYETSKGNFFDASYFRLKNISLSYQFPELIAKRLRLTTMRMYSNVQNLLTFWNRDSAILDPESGAMTASSGNIPPVRSVVFGVQVTL